MNRMYLAVALAALAGLSAQVRCAESVPLVVESKIDLGAVRGRIDHLAVDLRHRRLYVAELGNDSVGVVDLEAGKLARTLGGFSEPQGIGYEPSTDTLYVANARDGSVGLFAGGDLTPVGSIALGDDADNVRIQAGAGRVWVGYGSGALAMIDARTRHKTAEIPLPGHPESFRLEPEGSRIFVNVPDARQIAVLDRASNKQVATWKMGMTLGNFPLALDDSEQVLSVFRLPARLVVFREQDGQRAQTLTTCGDSDDLFFDAKRRRVYVTCGEGAIEVFSRGTDGYQSSGKLATSSGARTSLFVPELDRLYLAVRATSSAAAAIWVIRPES